MQIFAGSSNRELAGKIAELLGTQLGAMEISQFANGETRVWVKEPKIEKRVVVVQSLSPPTNEHLVELCLIVDALRRAGSCEVTAVIPWMGYSKQDKVFRPGEPLSAKVVAQILQSVKIDKIITIDLHNRATLGFFDIPIVELSARSLMVKYFRELIARATVKVAPIGDKNYVVVAPDAGAVKASTEFAETLGAGVIYMDKKRDLVSGKVSVVGMSGSVAGSDVLMVDDNVFTGSTLLATAKELKRAGAKSIRVGLTHHLYLPGVQDSLEKSEIDEIVVTDTIQRISESANQQVSNKLRVLSVARLIVDELR